MKQTWKHLKAVLPALTIAACIIFGAALMAQAAEPPHNVCGATSCAGHSCGASLHECSGSPAGLPNGDCETGEECDDGNLVNGDGCDNNCTLTACGNGITTAGEECDGGAAGDCKQVCQGGNPCTTDCKLKNCGDGRVTCDEQCDDGDTFNSDDCDSQVACGAGGKGTCTLPACGNGIVDIGEACDDGNTTNGDGCDNNCTPPGCGNGIVDAGLGETCDDGNTVNGDGCEHNCLLPRCGDGITDNGEQCDDGATVSCTNGCSATCKLEGCGNGVKECGEACDDGNTVNADGCEHDCTLPSCGNGITDPGESCDDGNTDSTIGTCPGNCQIVCGDGITSPGEACDTGECVCDVFPSKFSFGRDCGTFDGAADCALDGGSCVNAVASVPNIFPLCSSFCSFLGIPGCGAPGSCVSCATTGNSNNLPDHCRDNCKLASCGDGITDPGLGEGCDDGLFGTTGPATIDDIDDCPNGPSAIALHVACKMANECGDAFPLLNDTSDHPNQNANPGNPNDVTTGKPSGCSGALCAASEAAGPQPCDNGGGFIDVGCPLPGGCANPANLAVCIPAGACIPAPKTCAGNPTKTCADDVDCVDPQGTTGPCGNGNEPGQCRPGCIAPRCGDGITDPNEGCDDGNTVSTTNGGLDGDHCEANCSLPSCGNGITDAGEQCDADGANGSKTSNCTATCKFNVCGDKSTQQTEQCDDGNLIASDDCNNCVLNVCGDGVTDVVGPKNVEQCDDGNTAAEDGCFECCREAGSVTGNLPLEFAGKSCMLNKMSTLLNGQTLKNAKRANTLLKTVSKALQLEALASSISPSSNKGKGRNQICSLERRVRRLLVNVNKGIGNFVLSGNISGPVGSELIIKAEDASQWATQISNELLCTPR